ncbi:MAG: quinolinate synthase NadA [Candidatus Hydrogenedentes bacterium]|nr:quinolinate synthase NadA [Candidatus Hydrogenedentota bacterium]
MADVLNVETVPTLEETKRRMRERLRGVIPDFEVDFKAGIAHEILELKHARNAVILGHNYMEPALYHSVPDYTGDSLQLSAVSAQTDADIIVFCGVWFMGETAKILNPGKTVLVPSRQAGCSLAAGIEAADVVNLKNRFPGAPVVTYVNTYAAVKAESDYCCTSGNADKVVRHLLGQGHKRILFLPDEYLAHNTANELGIHFFSDRDEAAIAAAPTDEPVVIGWHSRCEVHELFSVEDVGNIRRQYPDAVILAHPECKPEVIELVDISGSTKAMADFVRANDSRRYALLTECSMGDNLVAEFPHREMVRACSLRCQHMNQVTLEQTLEALQHTQYEVELDPEVIERARLPIDRMLAIR